MSNNVFKANFIQFSSENTKVIESNNLVAKRLEGYSGVFRELEPEVVDAIEETNPEEAQMLAALLDDGENGGDDFAPLEVPEVMTEELRQDVLAEIEEMKAQAMAEIEESRKNVYAEAKEAGYRDGCDRAEEEYREGLSALERERAGLNAEYEELVRNIEPKMVEVITGVYKKVFGDGFYSNPNVMANLIHRALLDTEDDESIVIHVSSEDYETLLENKEKIFGKMHFSTEPEIRSEERLESGAAKVENAHGVIDCGIDTELTELTKMLRVLSYGGNE